MISLPDSHHQQTALVYADHFEYLVDELKWLDLLIQQQVTALRSQTQPYQRLAASRQVYITDEEVDWLLGKEESSSSATLLGEIGQHLEQFQSRIQARVAASLKAGIFLPLVQLAHAFGLSCFEVQAIVICLAPELHRKYDRLYAYLQDDITRKRPSIDLILTLLGSTTVEGWRNRSHFLAQSRLVRAGILQLMDDPQSPSGSSNLGRFLQLEERILDYLFGHRAIDSQLKPIASLQHSSLGIDQVLVEPGAKECLTAVIKRYVLPKGDRRRAVVHLYGPQGVGKRELTLAACAEMKAALLYCDLELLLMQEDPGSLLHRVLRENRLLQTVLYFDHLDGLLTEEPKAKALLQILMSDLSEYSQLTFLAGEKPWYLQEWTEPMAFQAIALSMPDVPLRVAVWRQLLESHFPGIDLNWSHELANQFRLTPGQMRAAVTWVKRQYDLKPGGRIDLADLYAACRLQSNQKLTQLAVKIDPQCGWGRLILPEDTLAQLKEICSQARYRYQVFEEWGFGRYLSYGKGLSALFSGPSGTGKTLAAEVIAYDLQVDLYKVDLAGVVSKYIGETEKNLARIFHEAETSNAVLFFDEADALFGKRTEVSDAHDRYANIETSYLLQKMEEYEGIVILATNLRENMDEAFTRRLRFIVEFPFPDDAHRLRIWKTHFPSDDVLSEEIDYELLARKFQITGGNIKNIVLNAAFYAAEAEGKIGMEHVIRGTKREFEKIGKLWSELN